MENNTDKSNRVYISGKIIADAKPTHMAYGEQFFEFTIEIPRLSGQNDRLPVTISERLMGDRIKPGADFCAIGQFRSYNKPDGESGKLKLMLAVFVTEVLEAPISYIPNQILLSGYICKPIVYRTTPLNREIADALLAVNRAYNKSDYIPSIAWGRNARFMQELKVGDRVTLIGRIQSREYVKQRADGAVTMTAYEVSISRVMASYGYDLSADLESLGIREFPEDQRRDQ